jgi:hypothetical protein
VYQQTIPWISADDFHAMARNLRALVRWLKGRADDLSTPIVGGHILQSMPESGHRAG